MRSTGRSSWRSTSSRSYSPRVGRASQTFTCFLREDIAPRLRELGFKGSGKRFSLPDNDHYAVVSFHTRRTGFPDRVRFTLNVSIVEKATWERAREATPALPAQPSAAASYGLDDGMWWCPVGTIVGGHERWWTLDADGARRDFLAREVLGAIEDAVLPTLRERLIG